MIEDFQHNAGEPKTKQKAMITTEQFDTLLQEQAASGTLTPIDSERALSEIRGGGDTPTKYGAGLEWNVTKGTVSGIIYFEKDGIRLEAEWKAKEKELIARMKAAEETKPAPKPPTPGTPTPTPTPAPGGPKLPGVPEEEKKLARLY